jgi:CheY-like chemotaxis protein
MAATSRVVVVWCAAGRGSRFGWMPAEKHVRSRRVIIADDHPTILRVVRQILDAEPRIEVVGEATNGLEAVGLVETLKPDVAVLNVVMPRMSGFV